MSYNFNIQLKPYGENHPGELKIDTVARYGYFERKNGEECGGLWFDRTESGQLEIVDYDGVYCLPKAICTALENQGIIVEDSFWPDR